MWLKCQKASKSVQSFIVKNLPMAEGEAFLKLFLGLLCCARTGGFSLGGQSWQQNHLKAPAPNSCSFSGSTNTGSVGLLCRKIHQCPSATKAVWTETSPPEQVAPGQPGPSWGELSSAEPSVLVQHSWTSITTLIKPAGESTSYFCHTEERGGFLLLDYTPVTAESNEPQSKQNDTM